MSNQFGGEKHVCRRRWPVAIALAAFVLMGCIGPVLAGDSYALADLASDELNAAIFSKGDLIIGGNGLLTVSANYHYGITSKDDLTIVGGNFSVTTAADGIRGRDFIAISGGDITVTATQDGLQSNNDEDPERGYILIEAGALDITAGGDGIQGETRVIINGGEVVVSAGGNDALDSAKGIKAGVDLTISDGAITIDSDDDALHSNGTLTINGGKITAASGDDGIHADASVVINGGDISVTRCDEGIEGAAITINDGNIAVSARDDGVNVSTGGGGFGMMGRPGPNAFAANPDNYLHPNGGHIVVKANGDGLDVNGAITMTGGLVITDGPTANDNGALDHSGFTIVGGTLIAVGSAGVAQAPDVTSTQYSVMVNLPTVQPAGTILHIADARGEDILTYAPSKAYQSVVFSSSALQNGASYTLYTGGSSTGAVADGLYTGGSHAGGTLAEAFTISGVVTAVGTNHPGFGPMGGLRGRRGP